MKRRGEYGFDGNMLGAAGMTIVMVAAFVAARWFPAAAIFGGVLLFTLLIALHTTRRGKFLVWRECLDALQLHGDERVLDVGCGRGAVLTMVARRLPNGHATGLDIWNKADQSGNDIDVTRRNIAAEGVRCDLVTSDMRKMPFADASFDLVVSSIAIHNILDAEGRLRAIDEIARVLKPGGRVALADLAWTRAYAQHLQALGLKDVKRRRLGWRFWWGPGYPATALVTAAKVIAPASAGA